VHQEQAVGECTVGGPPAGNNWCRASWCPIPIDRDRLLADGSHARPVISATRDCVSLSLAYCHEFIEIGAVAHACAGCVSVRPFKSSRARHRRELHCGHAATCSRPSAPMRCSTQARLGSMPRGWWHDGQTRSQARGDGADRAAPGAPRPRRRLAFPPSGAICRPSTLTMQDHD
jgi:hypothetical protein